MEGSQPHEANEEIQIPAEKLLAFLELARDCDSALREEAQEMRARADVVSAHNQQQAGFFEKLILLDTGTFALSLTFLSALGSHIQKRVLPLHLNWMYAGWLLLLASMILSWLENYFCYAQTVQMQNAAAIQTSSIRLKAKGLIVARFGQLTTGSIDVQGTRIDVTKLYGMVAETVNKEFRRQLDIPNATLQRASSLGKYGFRFGALALLCTALAVTCILIFAMCSAYVFTVLI